MTKASNQPSISWDGLDFFINFPLVENYDAHNHFIHTDHRVATQDSEGNVLLFAMGRDVAEQGLNIDEQEKIYLFKEEQGNKKPFARYLIKSNYLGPDTKIKDLKAFQDADQQPRLYLHIEQDDLEYILFSDQVLPQEDNNESGTKVLDIPFKKIDLDSKLKDWSIGINSEKEVTLMTIHEEDQQAYFYYDQGGREIINLSLEEGEAVEKIELAYQQGLSEMLYTCVVALVKSANTRKLVFVALAGDELVDRIELSGIDDFNENQIKTFGAIISNDNRFVLQVAAESQGQEGPLKTYLYECTFSLDFDDDGTLIIQKDIHQVCDILGHIDDLILSNAKVRLVDSQNQLSFVEVVDTFFVANYGSEKFLYRTHPKKIISTKGKSLKETEEQPEWHQPIPLMPANKIHLTRNAETNALDLFIAEEESEEAGEVKVHLRHHWVDHETTIWKSKRMEVLYEEPVEVITQKHKTSSTYIRILDGDTHAPLRNKSKSKKGQPDKSLIKFRAEEIQLSASQEVSVMVNDKHYQLSPTSYVTVPLDNMGGLSIINKTNSIQTPIYLISLAGKEEAIRIRTSGHLESQLTDTKAQGQFLNKLQQGSKGKYKVNDEHKNALDQIHQTREGLDKSSDITIVNRKASSYSQFKTYHPEHVTAPIPNFFMAISHTDDQGPKLFSNKQEWANYHGLDLKSYDNELEGFFSFVKHVVGDIVHAVKHIAKDVIHFVVEEAEGIYHLTIALAHGDFKAVIHSLEEMWATIDSFCHAILKDLADLAADLVFDVLSFVMGKEAFADIFLLQDSLIKLFKVGGNTLTKELKDIESGVVAEITALKNWTEREIGPAKKREHHPSKILALLRELFNNPVLNYVMDLLNRAISKILSLIRHNSDQDTFPSFDWTKIEYDGEKLIEDFLDVIKNSFLDVVELNFSKLLSDLKDGLLEMAEDMLDLAGDLVTASLEFLIQLITYLEKQASKPLELPFISAFYQEIARKTLDDVPEDRLYLSMEKGAAMVFAFPGVFILKAIGKFAGHRPILEQISNLHDEDIKNKTIHELIAQIDKVEVQKNSLSADKPSAIDVIADLAGIIELLYEILENWRNAIMKQRLNEKEIETFKDWSPKIPLFLGLVSVVVQFIDIQVSKDGKNKKQNQSDLLILDTSFLFFDYMLSSAKEPTDESKKEDFRELKKKVGKLLFVLSTSYSFFKLFKAAYDGKFPDMLAQALSIEVALINKVYIYLMSLSTPEEQAEAQEILLPEILTVLSAITKIGIIAYEDLK